MREIFNEFLQDLEFSKNRCQRTREIYSQVLGDFDKFLAGKEADEENARAYLRSRAPELATSTQSLSVSILRSFSRWEKLQGQSESSSSWNLKSPRITQKKIRVFAEEDLDLLLNVVEQRSDEEQLLFHLLYGSALRISEALWLKMENVELKKGCANVLGKGSKWRKVPLTPMAVKLLTQLSPTSGSWHSDQLNYQAAHAVVASWGEESGIDKKYGALHPHLLRHALASHLLRRGAKLPHIQKLLGHSHLSTTERYTHLEVDDLIRAYDRALPRKRA
jgi:integrase/recombinase XerC